MRRRWTPAEDAILLRRVPHEPTGIVATALGRTLPSTYQRARALGIMKTPEYYASVLSGRLGNGQGVSTRFPKGNVPHNKGIPRRRGWAPGRMAEHQFKPGCRQGVAAKNWCPVGTIRTDAEGYVRIKVREARPGEAYGFGNVKVWPMMNRYVWEQAHGPIPKGFNVAFKDGNKANCALDNLELISRRDLMLRNSVHNLPKPVAQAIQLLGALNRQIRKRERNGNQKQDRRPA
jgi:hypothetical protein